MANKRGSNIYAFIFAVFKLNPKLVLWSVLESIFSLAKEYVPLVFLALILKSFLGKNELLVILWAVIYILVRNICSRLELGARNQRTFLGIQLNNNLIKKIYMKITQIKYSHFLDDEFRQAYLTALDELYYECDYSDIIDISLKGLISLFKIIISVALLLTVIFSKPTEVTAPWLRLAEPLNSLSITLMVVVVSFLIYLRVTKRVNEEQRVLFAKHPQIEKVFSYINEKIVYNFSQYASLQTYNMKEVLGEVMVDNSLKNQKFFGRMSDLSIKNTSCHGLLYGFIAFFSYSLTGLKVMTRAIDISLYLSYSQAILLLNQAIFGLANGMVQLQRQLPYFKSLEKFLETPDLEGEEDFNPKVPLGIEFRNVSFKYPNMDKEALQDVNLVLRFEDKRFNVIVGENGAGKSTLILLMLGLLEPTSGQILINNQDLKNINKQSYWQHIGCVFQDHALLPGTIGENISTKVSYDSQKILKDLASLHFDILAKGYSLDTDIGEKISLSGGEKQKIAIARAMYKHSPFVVLDEPTASLDALSEQNIFEVMRKISQDSLAVMITHRMSLCSIAENIIVLDKGKVESQGHHLELLKTSSKYKELWEAQSKYYKEDDY